MQYVRNLSDSVSTAWNSINPATLSGAIDVIVVEQEDGTLLCSPFHVRFGKFSLLRPYEKKVEFKVNGAKQEYSMKLGEGGEAFFVFETTDNIPKSMQTSPLVSPVSSPPFNPQQPTLQEPEAFELDGEPSKPRRPPPSVLRVNAAKPDGYLTPVSTSPELTGGRPRTGDWSSFDHRHHSEDVLGRRARRASSNLDVEDLSLGPGSPHISDRSGSPPPLGPREAIERAMALSRELSAVNIRTEVTENGDLMLDMSGLKNNEDDAFRAEILARRVLSQELDGNYDVGALIGMDEQGNLWIYSSEEAKDAAMKKTMMEATYRPSAGIPADAASDPGYQSDDSTATASQAPIHRRSESDVGQAVLQTPPSSPGSTSAGDPNRNYAKTLRLTSDQLKALNLKPGENSMSFTVNRATCTAFMYLWKHETPVVISDIDGTITKSDALGHVLNMIGRDWTHAGVAKLYSDIANNGYNIMYLTSRSVGQADTTRAYLAGVVQDNYRLPRGPTILSPDRTMAALRREIYLRKPHIFKMATLRDIRNLYGPDYHPFYAGFGNRLTDQISYRTVDVPRKRIFTINSNAEVSLDLLSLNKKLNYVDINEIVEYYFPPVHHLVKSGGEACTDFMHWRDPPLELDEFSASESEEGEEDAGGAASGPAGLAQDVDEEELLEEEYVDDDEEAVEDDDEAGSQYADDDEGEEYEEGDELGDSYISHNSVEEYAEAEGGSYDDNGQAGMMSSIIDDDDDADDESDQERARAIRGRRVKRTPSPQRDSVADKDAELITGVKNLSMGKDAK